jgi:hypothetical protein
VTTQLRGSRKLSGVLEHYPVAITRADLVISLDQREQLEELARPARHRRGNRTERRTLLYIIRALALAAYEKDIGHPYTVAGRVCERADLIGINLSRETVAQKLKEASALTVAQMQ